MDAATLVLFLVIASLSSFFFGFRGLGWMFTEMSGWRKLEPPFACNADVRVWTYGGQTVRVNSVRFRHCVNAGIGADALYLRVVSIFRFKPLRIPWEHMTMFQPDTFHGRPAMRFVVAGAVIVVESPLYAEMYPHLVRSRSMLTSAAARG